MLSANSEMTPSSAVGVEKRLHQRHVVGAVGMVTDVGPKALRIRIADVSRRGMHLWFGSATDRKLFSGGAAISVTFTAELDSKPQYVTVRAQVKRLHSFGIGVSIYEADERALAGLRALVLTAMCARAEPPAPPRAHRRKDRDRFTHSGSG